MTNNQWKLVFCRKRIETTNHKIAYIKASIGGKESSEKVRTLVACDPELLFWRFLSTKGFEYFNNRRPFVFQVMNLFSDVCEWYDIVNVVVPDLNESNQAAVVRKADSAIQLWNNQGHFYNMLVSSKPKSNHNLDLADPSLQKY